MKRKADIKRRASEPADGSGSRCMAHGCRKLTQRASGRGLSEMYCKAHVEFKRRHGSSWRKSYSMKELGPFRKAAQRWLREHEDDYRVASVISGLDKLLAGSGPAVGAHDIAGAGLGAEGRAKAVLARVRETGRTGHRLLEIALTVAAAVSELGPRGDPEFRNVQIAKLIHRLASGTHHTPSGFRVPSKYPRAEGSFMRELGEMVYDIAGIAADYEAIQWVKESVRAANSSKNI